MSSDASSSVASTPTFNCFQTNSIPPDELTSYDIEDFQETIWPALSSQLNSYSALSRGRSVRARGDWHRFWWEVTDNTCSHPDTTPFARSFFYAKEVVQHRLSSRHGMLYSRNHVDPDIPRPRIVSEAFLEVETYHIKSFGTRLCRNIELPSLCKNFTKKEGEKKEASKGRIPACSLGNLPAKIVQLIADELPLSSRAAFGLASRSLRDAVGNVSRTMMSVNSHREEYETFLSFLSRDLHASHWFCKGCATLHCKAGGGVRMNYYAMLRLCPYAETSVMGRLGTLFWAHVYLVMERHRYGGAHGLPVGALSQNLVRTLRDPATGRAYSQHVTQQGKISGGELLVCISLRMDDTPRMCASAIRICQHMCGRPEQPTTSSAGLDALGREFEKVLRCRISHLGSPRRRESRHHYCEVCKPQTRNCKWCGVEYDFAVRQLDQRPQQPQQQLLTRLDLVVWANLGTGCDPSDPEWRLPQMQLKRSFLSSPPQTFECGSIRRRFEEVPAA